MTDQKKDAQSSSDNQPPSIWDNDLPAGDSPPLPRWPLAASITAYSVWMVILISMLMVRLYSTG